MPSDTQAAGGGYPRPRGSYRGIASRSLKQFSEAEGALPAGGLGLCFELLGGADRPPEAQLVEAGSFEAHARPALERDAPDGPVMVLALADIDGFKSVNDTCGHAKGDEVLRAFAKAGAAAFGEGDAFGRSEGDGFVLLLRASTAAAAASRVATVHRRLRDGPLGSGHHVGVSLGASVVGPETTLDWTTAIREAARLMYAAKRAGTGGFRIETVGEMPVPLVVDEMRVLPRSCYEPAVC